MSRSAGSLGRWRAGLCGLLLGVSAGSAMAAGKCERLIATGNPDYPPFLWRNPAEPKQLIGASADLLKRIGEEIGVSIEVIHVGPWSRAQEEARTGRVDLLAGAFISLPRLQTMDYVYPAAFSTPNMVWTREDSAFDYQRWDDLKAHPGAMLVNNSFGQGFDEFVSQLDMTQVPTMSQAFDMLARGRVDYVVFERDPGLALLTSMGLADDIVFHTPPVSSEGLHVTLSHESACNDAWLRGQLASKMAELSAADVPAQLLQQNLALWASQQAAAGANQE